MQISFGAMVNMQQERDYFYKSAGVQNNPDANNSTTKSGKRSQLAITFGEFFAHCGKKQEEFATKVIDKMVTVAYKKRDEAGLKDLSDKEISQFFYGHASEISKIIKTTGENAFIDKLDVINTLLLEYCLPYSQILECLKLDEKTTKVIDKMVTVAYKKRDEAGLKDLSDRGIREYFYGHASEISKIIKTTGENAFIDKLDVMNNMLLPPYLINSDILGYLNLDDKTTKSIDKMATEAFKKRDQLKPGLKDLSDKEINAFFYGNNAKIADTIGLIGENTFLNAYPTKLEGLGTLIKKCSHLKYNLSNEDLEKVMQVFNPEHSAKFAELNNEIQELSMEASKIAQDYRPKFEELRAKQNEMTKAQYKEALTKLSDEQNAQMPPIKELRAELRKMQDDSRQLDPKTKLQRVKALSAISDNHYDLTKFVDILNADKKTWTNAVNRKVFDVIGVEYNEALSNRLNLVDSEYLSEVLSSEPRFMAELKDIVELMVQNPDKSVEETLNALAQNIRTKKIFETMGIDYNNWASVDKNSFERVKIKTNEETAKKAAIENLEADFNDPAFKLIPKEQTDKLLEKLKAKDIFLKETMEPIYDADGYRLGEENKIRLYHKDKPLKFEQLELTIGIIKTEINQSDFWNSSLKDPALNQARETIREHMAKLRYNDMKRAQALKGDEESEIEVHKTDMNNITHALFLGNHGACCTAVGGINEETAPTYIKNKCIQAIEIMDGKDFVGNTMCYIAKVDNTPSLVLDNIELKTKYHNNEGIKDAIFKYARKITKDIGQPDMPIYLGPYRHKIDTVGLSSAQHQVNIAGSTNGEEVYIDYIGFTDIDERQQATSKLFKVPPLK